MKDPMLMRSYTDCELALQRYNDVLDQHLHDLRSSEGADAHLLERMTAGAKAMRDSSGIYLSYAKFVAYGMPESEDLIEDDDDDMETGHGRGEPI